MTQNFWLLEGSVLTDEQLGVMTQHGHAHPLYRFMKDARAEKMGPWLLPADTHAARELIEPLKGDDGKRWAVHALRTAVPVDVLTQHFTSLIHLWTADRQRYFLRFADGRSMRAVWAVLTANQQRRVMGPMQSWCTTARDGSDVPLFKRADQAQPTVQANPFRLTLNDQQLGALLERNWPDQLLAAVIEEAPVLSEGRNAAQLHDLAVKTCEWLKQTHEESFPKQKAGLAHVLQHCGGEWSAPPQPT